MVLPKMNVVKEKLIQSQTFGYMQIVTLERVLS